MDTYNSINWKFHKKLHLCIRIPFENSMRKLNFYKYIFWGESPLLYVSEGFLGLMNDGWLLRAHCFCKLTFYNFIDESGNVLSTYILPFHFLLCFFFFSLPFHHNSSYGTNLFGLNVFIEHFNTFHLKLKTLPTILLSSLFGISLISCMCNVYYILHVWYYCGTVMFKF